MNLVDLVTADWRIRLLAQITCAPMSRSKTSRRPASSTCVPSREARK